MKVDDKGNKLKGLIENPIYPDGIKPEKEPPIYTYMPVDMPEHPEYAPIPNANCYVVRSDLKYNKGHLPLWWCISSRGCEDPQVYKDFQTASLVAMSYYLQGESYFQEGYPLEAINLYNKAVQSAIDNKQLFNSLGIIYEKKGWNNKAKEAFTIALILDPNFLQAQRNLANVHFKLGEYPEAMKLYKSIAENKFGSRKESILLRIGDMHFQNGNYSLALKEYLEAMARYPAYTDARLKAGLVYMKLGNYDKAAEIFKDLLFIQPNNYKAHNRLGAIYQKLGLIEDAREEYKKSIEINNKFTEAYINLAVSYGSEKRWKEAKKILLDALNVAEKTPELLNSLGIVTLRLNNEEKALEYFKNAVQLDKSYKKGWINLAELYKRNRDTENYSKAMNQINEINQQEKINRIILK